MQPSRAKQGFMLVEWMVQFLLLATISIISYALIASWYRSISQTHRMMTNLLPLHIATDVMRSDLQQAAPDSMNIAGSTVSLRYQHKNIRWHLENATLFRTSGSYNKQKKRWGKPSKSLVAPHVKETRFTQKKDMPHNVRQVRIILRSGECSKPIEQMLVLRNGLIV